jgi:hypothetical protein
LAECLCELCGLGFLQNPKTESSSPQRALREAQRPQGNLESAGLPLGTSKELRAVCYNLACSLAEVVELADTPSDAIALAILYKLLILQLLPFASVTSSELPKDGQ